MIGPSFFIVSWVRSLLLICTLLQVIGHLQAQESIILTDSGKMSSIDTLPQFNEYIQDHKQQLNIKFEVSNDINEFEVENEGRDLALRPNLNLRYAFVFSYKFLSIRLGIRPNTSKQDQENKGESDTYRFRIHLLFDNWSHLLQYNYDRGYFVDNSNSIIADSEPIRIQLPYMTTNVFYGTSVYKFNENFSIRAVESQTEIQIKSAGTFVLGASYNVYKLVGLDRVLLPGEDIEFRDPYNEYYGAALAATGGYYYTYVLKKNWFLNGFLQPSVGIDMHQTRTTSGETQKTRHNQEFFGSVDYGLGIGFNGEKFFFGGRINNRWTNEKFNEDKINIQPRNNTFDAYFGYRFKAPKSVSKPVDMIEKKVPMLKDDN